MSKPDDLFTHLQEKKFYNIDTKKVETIPSQPPSQPPVSSDQGSAETCTSHAVGKADVAILDGFGYNSDQDKIIENCENAVGRKKVNVEDFSSAPPITLPIRKEGDGGAWQDISVKHWIQRQPVDQNWQGPAMTPEQLQEHHMAMVVVWNLDEKLHRVTGPHAVYAKSFFQKQKFGILKGAYIFECINSWGKLDKTPLVHEEEIRDLYYVSLYSDTAVKAGAGVPKPSGGQKMKPGGGPGPQQDEGQGGNSIVQNFSGNNSTNMGGNMVFGNSTTHYHNK